jgi:hypothetical protein
MERKQFKNSKNETLVTVIINIAKGISSNLFSWIFKCQFWMGLVLAEKSKKYRIILILKSKLLQLHQIRDRNMNKIVLRQE